MKNKIFIFLLCMFISGFSDNFALESTSKSEVQKGSPLDEKVDKTPWMGLMLKDYFKEKVKKREADGVLVDDFIEKGPAKISGIKKGDIIKSVDNLAVKSQNEFENIIFGKKVGDKIKIQISRDNKEIELEITLENTWSQVKDVLDKLGIKVNVVDNPNKPVNVIISDIKINSPAYKAKLNRGNLILGINRKVFNDLNEFGQITSQVKLDETVFLTVMEDNSVLTKELSPNVPEPEK